MSHDALEVVKLKRNFYRDSYRIVVMLLFLSIFINGVMAWVVIYQESHKPTPKYFATTSTGELIPMIPLDQPNLSDASLLQWVVKASASLYTYDFLNYRSTFDQNAQYFTKSGWSSFLASLKDSRNLEAVTSKKLILQATPAGVPVIVNQQDLRGVYTWRIQLPLLVKYQSLSETFNRPLMLNIVVQRLSTLSSKYGVGIAQLVVQQQSAQQGE